MKTLPRTQKPLKAVQVRFTWIHYPIWPCECLKHGSEGILELNGQLYSVLPLGSYETGGYRLYSFDTHQCYDIDTTPAWGWQCDCPDAIYRHERPNGCKHVVGLKAALAQLWED